MELDKGKAPMHPNDLLALFLTAKEANGLSFRTLQWYEEQITLYIAHCTEPDLVFDAPETIDDFLASERRRNLSPSTISARYRALSAWFTWLVKRRLLPSNPIDLLDRPRVPRKKMRHVTIDQFMRLYISVAGDGWIDYRDRVLMLLMFFSGLRVGEVVGLSPGDVNLQERLLLVREAKGGQEREVPCAPDLPDQYVRYMLSRPAAAGSALFVASDGYIGVRGALTSEGVRQMLRRRCKDAGLPALNPHAFRHGFAMLFLNAGMELSALSKTMGHASEQTTKGYAHWLNEGLRREYNDTMKKLRQPGTDNG